MKKITLKSPAKINLNLQILNKREDFYHNIKSEFCTINLFDKITLTKIPEGIQIVTSGKYKIPNNRSNLVYQVAEKIRSHAKSRVGVKIEIDKQIPLFAGLGGGSSNAATVIKGLIELWDLDLSLEKQIEIGKKIGADIPFFLYGEHCLIEGIGEKITPLETSQKAQHIIVAQLPYIKISTPWAYDQWDKRQNNAGILNSSEARKSPESEPQESQKESLKQKEILRQAQDSTNDFEKVIFPHFPDLENLKKIFLKSGATKANMTGSGSSIYGVFDKKEIAEKCLRKIENKCEFVFLGKML